MTLIINSLTVILFFGIVTEYYHRTDNLEADYDGLTPYIMLCMLGMPFLTPNAYFLFVLLVFHTYTDEQMQSTYTLPTLIAGGIELVALMSGDITAATIIAVIICVVIVHIMSAVGAFAKGDVYMLDVLLLYAGYTGGDVFNALLVIIGAAYVCFLVKMLIVNAIQLINKNPLIRQSPFMGSIFCGYVVYCILV